MTAKKNTVSLASTPVQRALAKAKRSTLLLLFVAGIAFGLVYKSCTKEGVPAGSPPAATQEQR